MSSFMKWGFIALLTFYITETGITLKVSARLMPNLSELFTDHFIWIIILLISHFDQNPVKIFALENKNDISS